MHAIPPAAIDSASADHLRHPAHPDRPTRRQLLRRGSASAAASLLLGCGLAGTGPALAAVGSQVQVSIVERDSGATASTYRHRGAWYVPGRPGARYAIRITNRTGERVLAVMSVDGINIVTGQTASFDQGGYVLAPWQSYDITGWRKSQREVAAFVFTALPDSYAARTGRPDEVGVIGVALFKERAPRPTAMPALPAPPVSPPIVGRADAPAPAERRAQAQGGAVAEAQSSARAEADSAARAAAGSAAPAAQERLGTGHGEREHSYSSRTHFERAGASPVEVLSIRYDSHENLVLAGVIPPPLWSRPSPQPSPNPFPRSMSGFVPDPPRQ